MSYTAPPPAPTVAYAGPVAGVPRGSKVDAHLVGGTGGTPVQAGACAGSRFTARETRPSSDESLAQSSFVWRS